MLLAILDALSRDETNGVEQRMTLGEWADHLKARQKKLYGDRVSIEEDAQPDLAAESLVEMFDRIRRSVPDEAWDELPTDLVKNKKYYLYGHPKEED